MSIIRHRRCLIFAVAATIIFIGVNISHLNLFNKTFKKKNRNINIVSNETSDNLKILLNDVLVLKNGLRSVDNNKVEALNKRIDAIIETIDKENEGILCPEIYKNHYRWVEEKCDITTSLNYFLTVVIDARSHLANFKRNDLIQSLKNIATSYPGISVLLALERKLTESEEKSISSKINVIQMEFPVDGTLSSGAIWNELVSNVKTAYVLIGNEMNYFHGSDEKLKRLVESAYEFGVDFAGGAYRDQNGHWNMNCVQASMKHYALKMESGYDFSSKECLFCDIIAGPFIARVHYLNENPFDENLSEDVLFYDYFIAQVKSQKVSIVCPDSMFYVSTSGIRPSSWLPVAIKHTLYKIQFPESDEFHKFQCKDLKITYEEPKTFSTHPCFLKGLVAAIEYVLSICKGNNVTCELIEGTALGAVKFNAVLPWEVDADLALPAPSYGKILHVMTKNKRRLRIESEQQCCLNGEKTGGYFVYYQGDNMVEILGRPPPLDPDVLKKIGLKPTKVLFNGKWTTTGTNPGLFVRNRYGYEIYKHAEHWRKVGHKHGFTQYTAGTFNKCSRIGSSGCLDLLNTDGNIIYV